MAEAERLRLGRLDEPTAAGPQLWVDSMLSTELGCGCVLVLRTKN